MADQANEEQNAETREHEATVDPADEGDELQAGVLVPGAAADAGAPQLYLARFLFGRPLAISRVGFNALFNNLIGAMRPGAAAPSLRALMGYGDGAACDDHYDVDATGLATIAVRGVLVNHGSSYGSWITSYDDLRAALRLALADASVKAVCFDVDSPGGEVEGLFDFVDEIYAARGTKPLAAIVNEGAYSAAYAIASATERIYLPRSAGVGSIGTICEHWDYSGMLEQWGIKVTAIFAGDRKNDGSPWGPLEKQAKAAIQSSVDAMNGIFLTTAARNRGLSVDQVRGMQAGIFFGADDGAVKAGLADLVTSVAAAKVLASGQTPSVAWADQLAAAGREADHRVEAERTELHAWVDDVLDRCMAARRPELAVDLLRARTPREALGAKVADLLAAGAGPEISTAHSPLAAGGDSPIVKAAKETAARRAA